MWNLPFKDPSSGQREECKGPGCVEANPIYSASSRSPQPALTWARRQLTDGNDLGTEYFSSVPVAPLGHAVRSMGGLGPRMGACEGWTPCCWMGFWQTTLPYSTWLHGCRCSVGGDNLLCIACMVHCERVSGVLAWERRPGKCLCLPGTPPTEETQSQKPTNTAPKHGGDMNPTER